MGELDCYENGTVMDVRRVSAGDIHACLRIVRGLPEYFTPDVPEKVRVDLERHHGWVAARDGQVAGFTVVERRGTRAAEVLWAAVDEPLRGRRVGGLLMREVLAELRADGVQLVEVKTLDGSVDYEPYESTRAFWERMGFVQIDTIDPLPGWSAGNPAAIYVLALG